MAQTLIVTTGIWAIAINQLLAVAIAPGMGCFVMPTFRLTGRKDNSMNMLRIPRLQFSVASLAMLVGALPAWAYAVFVFGKPGFGLLTFFGLVCISAMLHKVLRISPTASMLIATVVVLASFGVALRS
jgi:hypothetical protein